ncbi:MAG: hypothetical protein GC185_03600 [Alphaproteobacteria bacterium]|nr:hypothetical protein [Alphaproteobacteria bacterium]
MTDSEKFNFSASKEAQDILQRLGAPSSEAEIGQTFERLSRLPAAEKEAVLDKLGEGLTQGIQMLTYVLPGLEDALAGAAEDPNEAALITADPDLHRTAYEFALTSLVVSKYAELKQGDVSPAIKTYNAVLSGYSTEELCDALTGISAMVAIARNLPPDPGSIKNRMKRLGGP